MKETAGQHEQFGKDWGKIQKLRNDSFAVAANTLKWFGKPNVTSKYVETKLGILSPVEKVVGYSTLPKEARIRELNGSFYLWQGNGKSADGVDDVKKHITIYYKPLSSEKDFKPLYVFLPDGSVLLHSKKIPDKRLSDLADFKELEMIVLGICINYLIERDKDKQKPSKSRLDKILKFFQSIPFPRILK